MDTNKRGKISLTELKDGLQKLGQQLPDSKIQVLMDSVSVPVAKGLNSRQ